MERPRVIGDHEGGAAQQARQLVEVGGRREHRPRGEPVADLARQVRLVRSPEQEDPGARLGGEPLGDAR